MKGKLILAPIICASDWKLSFEIMYDACDHAIGDMLGQMKYKKLYVILLCI